MEQAYNERTREQTGEMIYKLYMEWDEEEEINLSDEQILLMREYVQRVETRVGGQK